jgi:hypothetical protein
VKIYASKKMQCGIRDFCMLARQVDMVNAEKKERTCDLVKNRKTAHEVLREFIAADPRSAGSVKPEYALSIGADMYKVEMKQPKVVTTSLSSGVCDDILTLWDQSPQDIADIFRKPIEDPAVVLAEFIEAQVFGKMEPKARPATVVVSKFKARANVDPPEEAPADWKSLIESVLECNEALSAINKEHKERKSDLDKQKKVYEDKLVGELDTLPPGTIQKVSMLNADEGGSDTYYVRVKPPKKLPKRKISSSFFRKTLRTCLQDTLISMDAHVSVSDLQVGEALCGLLREKLQEKETREPEDRRRVSLDKMRTKSNASE